MYFSSCLFIFGNTEEPLINMFCFNHRIPKEPLINTFLPFFKMSSKA